MKPAALLWALATVGPLAGAAGLVTSCKRDTPAAAESGGRGGRGTRSGDGGVAFAVDALQLEAKKLDYAVTAPGVVDAFERVQVTARVAGVVDRVGFREGQEVKKGDVLVVIDSQRFQLAVNSAKAALEKAQASQKDMEAMVARREGASTQNPGLIPGEELETFRTKSLTAKADTSVAQENLKVAQLNLSDSAVRAPMGGVIQTRTVETGQYVNTGYVMATLLQREPMLLRFSVEPLEAPRIKPGMVARFTLRETQKEYTASISLVSAAADPTTHMVGVTAQVSDDAKGFWLRPGSFCDVTVDVGAARDAVVIPRAAARATDHGYVVYALDGDVATERVITLGMSSKDGWVEVRTGLAPGDWIVVRGAEALSVGAKVRATRLTGLDGGAVPSIERPPGSPGAGDPGAPAGDAAGERRRGRDGGGGRGAAGEHRP